MNKRIQLSTLLLIFICSHSTEVLSQATKKTRVVNPAGISEFPRWSPDGTQIAFMSTRDGNYEIYVINEDGSNEKRLTNNIYNDMFPSWSPDGKKITFSSKATAATPWVASLSAVFTMDANGESVNRITNVQVGNDRPTAYFNDTYPIWSPKGDRIAFLSDRDDGYREIFWVSPDGSGLTQLTFHKLHHWNLVWSHDGDRIIFDGRADGTFPGVGGSPEWGIFSISVGGQSYDWGNDLQTLANEKTSAIEYDSAISPDGRTLAFHIGQKDPEKRTGIAGLRFAEIDYSDGKMKIKEESIHIRSKDNKNQFAPSWSPDGKKIAFASTRDGYSEIYTMDADGKNVKRLTYSRGSK